MSPPSAPGKQRGRGIARARESKGLERKFSRALADHQSGRVADAEKRYREILRRQADHVGALYYLALLLEQTGRGEASAEYMARAVEIRPGDAVLQNNFGNLLKSAGRPGDAVRAYRESIRLDPGYANACFNLGVALQEAGDPAGAREAFEELTRRAPGDGDGWTALGTALVEQGEPGEALGCFERAVALKPDDPRVAYNHGGCLRNLDRIDEAAAEYRRALALAPDFAEASYNLALVERLRRDDMAAERAFRDTLRVNPRHAKAMVGLAALERDAGRPEAAVPLLLDALDLDSENARAASLLLACFVDQGELDHAAGTLSQRVDANPENAALRMALGEVFMELDRWDSAAAQYLAIIERKPDHAGAHNGLSRAYDRLRRADEAIAACREAIAFNPRFADAYSNLGLALRQKGRTREAIEAYEDAIRVDPGFSAAWNNLGIAYSEIGDIDRALECYDRAVKLEPDLAAAYLNISRNRKFTTEDMPEIEKLESMAARGGLTDEGHASFHCALGKMYEDCGDYDRAFEHYVEFNRSMRRRHPFDRSRFVRWAAQFHEVFDADFFDSVRGYGNPSERPVFIVGMPRSGTTLVEQILASHPDVYGADELTRVAVLAESLPERLGTDLRYPRCVNLLDAESVGTLAADYLELLDSLAGDEARVTDKMPTNFFHLGLIGAMFPNARIIHCQRDAMDVCLSNFVQIFAEAHYYSYDLIDTAAYYREYEKLMAHWRELLPLPTVEIAYESLIENQESETRRLVEFLGLPWDDRCLEFHRTKRSVRTASNWQVRQPIYRTSARRWKRFEGHLDELKRALGYDGGA